MTELEAVNRILNASGRRSVTSLSTGDNQSEAAAAIETLGQIEQSVLGDRWHFNTRREVTLTPDATTSKIALPDTAISVFPSASSAHRQITTLGRDLYDLEKNTDQFTGSIVVDIVHRVDFVCSPPVIQEYIVAEAAVRYYEQWVNDPWLQAKGKLPRLERERDKAKGNAKTHEVQQSRFKITDTPTFVAVKGKRNNRGRILGGDY